MKRLYSTDLAIERRRARVDILGVEYKKEEASVGAWERLTVSTKEGAEYIGKPVGIYDTLELGKIDELDYFAIDDATDEVARELCLLVEQEEISPDRLLIVGLGNPKLTPDAIGPTAAGGVEPTMHLKGLDEKLFNSLECSEIAVLTPGVRSVSGIDTAEVVLGVARSVRGDVVIVIDALVARSPKRLGTTIQFSNTGIQPSSGVGVHQRGIDEDLLKIPVISIGVPTVIDSSLFIEGEDEGATEGMLVAPKDIDRIVELVGKIIAGGINQAFGIFF